MIMVKGIFPSFSLNHIMCYVLLILILLVPLPLNLIRDMKFQGGKG